MRQYRGLFRPLGAFTRHQFSADYTITMSGFDFRQRHRSTFDRSRTHATDAHRRLLLRHLSSASCASRSNFTSHTVGSASSHVLAMFDHAVDVIRTTYQKFLIATGVAEDSGFAVPRLEGLLARRHP